MGRFFECTGLTSVVIPEGVTGIADDAFRGCTDLNFVTIPKSVTDFGGDVFYDCPNLTIYGYTNAEEYAVYEYIPFVSLDSAVLDVATGISVRFAETKRETVELQVKPTKSTRDMQSYDITLLENGVAIRPDDEVTVRIPADAKFPYALRQEENGSFTDMHATRENGCLVFKTTDLGRYTVATTDTPQNFLPGDANGDGDVTTADARLILQYAAELVSEDKLDMKAANVNDDNEVTTADARLILQYCAELLDELPVKQ